MTVEAFRLDGRVALVTGGNSGLGRQALDALEQVGAACFCVSRSGIDALTGLSLPDTKCRVIDLTAPGAAQEAFDAAEQQLGPVDILVNSAGISTMGRAEDNDAAAFSALLAINLVAVQSLSAEFVRRCKARKAHGSIINIGSVLAENAMRGTSLYAASKAAVDQMSRVQALEWGRHGIRVNVIAPGWFLTPMTEDVLGGPGGALLRQKNPLGRLGGDGDISGAVQLLASDAGRYITGATLHVDGGQHLVP